MPSPKGAMVVTGASSGIGRALALAAAKDGFSVVLTARRAERLDEVTQAIGAAGGRCTALVADVTAPGAAERIVNAAMRAFERIDVVVNNAGSGAYGPLLAQSDAAIEAQWQLHVAAPLRIARAALPHLERSRGHLLFVGSGLARTPLPAYGAYAPVKAAIRAAATQLRRELRASGVAVTYVDPGLVATEFHGAMGIRRSSRIKAVAPERVARAMLRGIDRRAAGVNAVPWQTAGTVIGEWLAALGDPIIARMAAQPGDAPAPRPGPPPVSTASPGQPSPTVAAPPVETAASLEGPFHAALEPVARRMERVKLSPTFVREVLVPGTTLELNELAMRWAGMPNKNERAAMHDVLEALAAAGYLEPLGDETWKVLHAAG